MVHYFDDLAIGDAFESKTYTFTKEDIVEFAQQFDPQPFHVDEAAAAESMFGELVASGLHTLCVSQLLTVEDVFVEIANVGGARMDELRWHKPVTPGDSLSLRVEVADKSTIDHRPERGIVTFERILTDSEGEEVMTTKHYCGVERRQ